MVSVYNRPHAAEEVYVTGTFDNWEKSEQLDKVGQVFQKTVTLPDTSEKIYYKVGECLYLQQAPTAQPLLRSCDS